MVEFLLPWFWKWENKFKSRPRFGDVFKRVLKFKESAKVISRNLRSSLAKAKKIKRIFRFGSSKLRRFRLLGSSHTKYFYWVKIISWIKRVKKGGKSLRRLRFSMLKLKKCLNLRKKNCWFQAWLKYFWSIRKSRKSRKSKKLNK